MLELLTEGGLINKFPRVCPHCDATYWVQPGSLMAALPKECLEALRDAHGEDEGARWWGALIEEGKRLGRGIPLPPVRLEPTDHPNVHRIVRG